MTLIPSACKACDSALSVYDMQFYLDTCERTGSDPMRAARMEPPGILCRKCFARALGEAIEDSGFPAR